MSVFEVGPDPTWEDIRKFATNILGTADWRNAEETLAKSSYFACASRVLIAQRMDKAIGLVQEYMLNAAQHVGKVSERGTKLMIEASDRAIDAADRQAQQVERHARSLRRATRTSGRYSKPSRCRTARC